MPVFPSKVVVTSGDTMRQLVDGLRAPLFQGADYVAEVAIGLHPDIVNTLRSEGADEHNRLGFGSSANKAADTIALDFHKAAEHMKAAAEYLAAAGLDYKLFVSEPLRAAEARRQGGAKLLKP